MSKKDQAKIDAEAKAKATAEAAEKAAAKEKAKADAEAAAQAEADAKAKADSAANAQNGLTQYVAAIPIARGKKTVQPGEPVEGLTDVQIAAMLEVGSITKAVI